MKIVEVTWLDATYEAGEFTEEELKELLPVQRRHIGYVLSETETEIRLSPGMNEWSKIKNTKDTFDNSLAIPKGTILKVTPQRDDD